jgi:adenylyl cyclase-associated protein
MFRSLKDYVKQHYTQGVTWNAKGVDAKEALQLIQNSPVAASAGPVAPPAGGPPPPPPPPPLPKFDTPPDAAKSGGLDAVFSELNKGEAVTAGLRKVSTNQMTHKNPSLRASSTVPTRSDSQNSISARGKSSAPPGKKPKPESMRTKKPPRKELDGNKWIIVMFPNGFGYDMS